MSEIFDTSTMKRRPAAAAIGIGLALTLGLAACTTRRGAAGAPARASVVRFAPDKGGTGRLPARSIPIDYSGGAQTWTATAVSTAQWSYAPEPRTLSIDMGNAVTNDFLAIKNVTRSPACVTAIGGCGPSAANIQVYNVGDAAATFDVGGTVRSSGFSGLRFAVPRGATRLTRLTISITRAGTVWTGDAIRGESVSYTTRSFVWPR